MGSAKCIGRVGGLAAALGVGIAVATAPGLAWAETDSGSSVNDPPAKSSTDKTSTNKTSTNKTSTAPDVRGDQCRFLVGHCGRL